MIDWNEDNFLERLAPQLRQKSGGGIGPCPDAVTLCAVFEGEARQPERDAVAGHLSRCATCADLRSRLLSFESEGPPVPEAVWNQTRTRLDNWLEGFLRSEAAHFGSPERGKPSRRVSGWESISNFFTSRRIIWALSGALVLALIVNGVLLLEYKRDHLPQVQVAVHPTFPPQPPANATPAEKPPEKSTEKPNITPQEEGLPRPPALSGKPMASPEPGPNAPAGKSLPAPPSVARNAAAAAPLSHLPTLRLDPAGRILIVLSSISFKPDGSFQFHGILLLPVPLAGLVPLDRGTEVVGAGTRSQGQTSLAVTGLVVQGVRYTLKEGSGQMTAQTPGAGGGVHFDRSQVLEMWPTATAVYEKASDQTVHPEPQK